MPRSRFISVLIIMIAGLAAMSRSEENVPMGYRSKAEKLALLAEAQTEWRKINRWLVEYEATPIDTKLGLLGAHRIMAVAAPNNLFHMGASFADANPWQADPFRQEYFLYDGVACHRWPFNRAYSTTALKKGAAIPGSLPHELLLTIIP